MRLWESAPDAMAYATASFDGLVGELVAVHGGVRPSEQGEGDSFVAAFPVAHDAVSFVIALYRTLRTETWATTLPLRVRTAVHTGTAQLRDDDNYMGPTVNRCARIRALGHGGQVLLSGTTTSLIRDELPIGASVIDRGMRALRDFERPEHVFQLAHADVEVQLAPLRGDRGAQVRPPEPRTSFIARTQELKALDELVARERLVTLTGAGGSGKTRLASEWARRRIEQETGGLGWADAAPVADGALLVSCAATALGVREVPSEPLIDTLVREIGERETVMVIDNCEHLIDDAARLVDRLVADCPNLRVLATSREALGVAGEVSMSVPSLDESAAVQLFVDRALAASANFSMTPASEVAIAEICRRLDGIPLGIELAAARARVLSPQQIAEGLADRFRLLTGGARTALPRQRTLEASVDWSYRLLSQPERTLLDRLSVFSGTFTLGAAGEVCAGGAVPESSVLNLLSALVDKSLVQVHGSETVEDTRYRVLETIRHFARQRLADHPDSGDVRDRHLAHYLALAEELGPRVEGGGEIEWLDRLDDDVDNLRAALEWAEQSSDTERMLRLGVALWLLWEVRCRFDEACTWLGRALAAAPEPTQARAAALYGLGDLSLFTLDLRTVVNCGEEVLHIGEHLGDKTVLARGTTLLGWAACLNAYRDTQWAREALTEVLASLPEDVSPWLYCDATIALGLACVNEGDLTEAAAAFDQAIASATRVRSVGSLQRSFHFRGMVHGLVGEAAEAVTLLGRAVDLADELDETYWRTVAYTCLAYARLQAGDRVGAIADATDAVAMGTRDRNLAGMGLGALEWAKVLVDEGHDNVAETMLEDAAPTVRQVGLSWATAWLEGCAALIQTRRGDIERAREGLAAAAPIVKARPYARAVLATYRGWSERLVGEDLAAEAAFTEAIEAAAAAGARAEVAIALDELGVSAARRGKLDRAAHLFAAADAERARLGIPRREVAGVPDRAKELVSTREALGEDAFDNASRAGSAMTLEEAARLALRGRGGRRGTKAGWESLTPAEHDVIRLAADGLTNAAIAEKLLVSPGTVKVHLSHVFAKLGVSSRAELAAEATRREPS